METVNENKYNLVSTYLGLHPGIYSDFEEKCILDYVKYEKEDSPFMVPDLVRELYDELGLLTPHKNIYTGFMNIIDREFGYADRKIVEVAGGILPRLGERISVMQNTGTITVFDPRLNPYKHSTDKLKLIRSKFSSKLMPDDTDLLLGLMPCEATLSIIDAALENKINFMIALCEGGPHGDIYDYFEDEEEWLDSTISYARRGVEDVGLGKLEMDYLKEYNDPYPVIYNKRK